MYVGHATVLQPLTSDKLKEILDEYNREGPKFTATNNPKWSWFSNGFRARMGQVIVMVKTRNPKYSEHFTKEPTPLQPDRQTTDPVEMEEPLAENHEPNASKQTTQSITVKQKPPTTIPLQKLEEQCYGVIMDSTRQHHPLEIRVGDILVVDEQEGIVLKSGGVGGIVTELTKGDTTSSS